MEEKKKRGRRVGQQEEPCVKRKICGGAYKNLGPSFLLSLIARQELSYPWYCCTLSLDKKCGDPVKGFPAQWPVYNTTKLCADWLGI